MLERAAPDVGEHRSAFDCMAAYGIWNKHRRRDTIYLARKFEISVNRRFWCRGYFVDRVETYEAVIAEGRCDRGAVELEEIHSSVYGQRGKNKADQKAPEQGLAVKRQLSNTFGAELRGLPQEKGSYSACSNHSFNE